MNGIYKLLALVLIVLALLALGNALTAKADDAVKECSAYAQTSSYIQNDCKE